MCDFMLEDDVVFLMVKGVGVSKFEKYGEIFMVMIWVVVYVELVISIDEEID